MVAERTSHRGPSGKPSFPKHASFYSPWVNYFCTESDCNTLDLISSWKCSLHYQITFWQMPSFRAQYARFPSFSQKCSGTLDLSSCSYCWMQSSYFDLSPQSSNSKHFKPCSNFTFASSALSLEPFVHWPICRRISPPAYSKESNCACLFACFFLKKSTMTNKDQ